MSSQWKCSIFTCVSGSRRRRRKVEIDNKECELKERSRIAETPEKPLESLHARGTAQGVNGKSVLFGPDPCAPLNWQAQVTHRARSILRARAGGACQKGVFMGK